MKRAAPRGSLGPGDQPRNGRRHRPGLTAPQEGTPQDHFILSGPVSMYNTPTNQRAERNDMSGLSFIPWRGQLDFPTALKKGINQFLLAIPPLVGCSIKGGSSIRSVFDVAHHGFELMGENCLSHLG